MAKPNPDPFDTSTTEGWLNELAVQLRLRGATGAETGEALAEVESHLVDSGETAQEAFGDPQAYAITLIRRARREGPGTFAGALFTGASAYLAATLAVDAIRTWGGATPVTVGTLVALGAIALMVLVFTAFSSEILGTKKMWGVAVWMVVGLVAVILPGIVLRQVVFTLPSAAALALAIALLLAGLAYLRVLSAGDPIRDPRVAAPPLDAAESDLVASGRPLEAIRAYRRRTGASLADAKAAVDRAGSHPAAG